MDHVAIMKKSWGFLEKIATGEKTIESRWYGDSSRESPARRAPWDRVAKGDRIYFKNSGEPVTLCARVKKVLQFENLTPRRVKDILTAFGERAGITHADMPDFYMRFKDKKYCVLIFLERVRRVTPFAVNKRGFGAMAAWISVSSISKIRREIGR